MQRRNRPRPQRPILSTVAARVSPARLSPVPRRSTRSTRTTAVLTKGHAGVAILPTLLAMIDGAHPGEPPRRRRREP
jgi:hypothetical protein